MNPLVRAKAGAPVTIETARLVLRPPSADDFADLLALWTDPVTLAFLGRASTPAEAWARMLKYAGHWSLFGFGYWMLREAGTGRFVGEGGLAHQKRDGIDGGDPEAGWALVGSAQGKGYGQEALAAILAWGDTCLPSPRTLCLIDRANHASIRLAERNGYRASGEATLNEAPVVLFERMRVGLAG
ncbi:GNAT family N-acetyltransferase [Sphingosinicella rhizophila]|uniref:GNAT family N-acetyltransferase n=1 Tax=Sphingosinicella rhizophila TaxID=3050082 RepID=A0ABU3Q412_9SPHN|nr:GNAT family N-acetyltransferase [Sphingosinicella sp. GR2756]MDT9598149.1 GNAT family N-acetyltransferase [Sphingosinicella sp. GR2756]